MPDIRKSVLILGGTGEASELAERLENLARYRVITSLAGRTLDPRRTSGEIRIGGFGGAESLATFLREEAIDVLVDATHPFAETISANAARAAEISGTRLLVLQRPAWPQEPGDRWIVVKALQQACQAIPPSSRVLLALGRQYIAAFTARPDVHFIIRMVDRPDEPLAFTSFELIIGKPSADPAAEERLLRDGKVSHIVCRNSGGDGAYAKILAARRLSIPIIMIDRPTAEAEGAFNTVESVLTAIA
ncbi:MAG: cobalt-precorrin-6A reductase [Rhizobiaceae bacterium]|nr:cobalt-precorrin-6A reductase [Rhizobiaceae bacterium]